MDIQLKITSPNNCDHWYVKAITPKGEKTFVFLKEDLQLEPDDLESIVKAFIRYQMQDKNLTSMAQLKTAVEGKVHKI